MDIISFSNGVYKLIRDKVKSLKEHVCAGNAKSYDDYLKLTGQMKTLEELEQDVKRLLDEDNK